MLRKRWLLVGIMVIMITCLVITFNPFYVLRFYTPQSCTITNLPSHLLIINSWSTNWTGTQVVSEGWHVICPSHPDSKYYGCSETDCYGDNGTYVLTGQRYTLSDGSYHDLTEWVPKSSYFGVLVADYEIGGWDGCPGSFNLVLVLPYVFAVAIVVSLIVGLLCWRKAETHSPVTTEESPDGKV